MSKMASKVMKDRSEARLRRVTNFMGGSSFELDALDTLRLVACSSIFGEPQYYRSANPRTDKYDGYSAYGSIIDNRYANMSTSQVFEKLIDDALDADFAGTLDFAVKLRKEFWMRLNPQIIMVRAAIHPGRKAYTEKFPGRFSKINAIVMARADEAATQVTYYLYLTGDKKKMPSVLKRSIADRMAKFSAFDINKYKNAEIGMINTVRIVHASSPVINELMQTGSVTIPPEDLTWEQLRSMGMTWRDLALRLTEQTRFMGHMSVLRNLRNFFQNLEDSDTDLAMKILDILKKGVPYGRQFPFRYESAYNEIKKANDVKFKSIILDALEECIDLAIDNLPKLKGKTVALSDNSGSAWGTVTSEYGTKTVAEIDNLSSFIAAKCSDYGEVKAFGERLIDYPVSKRNGLLSQATAMSKDTQTPTGEYGWFGRGTKIGARTEAGIWHFFRDALKNKTFYDNIFIFSDMQAGTGQLYGDGKDRDEYFREGYGINQHYNRNGMKPRGGRISAYDAVDGCIDVYKLIDRYRATVNPKVNVFCVQTAGYPDTIMPIMSYRTAFLAGWTGKEVQFAYEYIREWDRIEAEKAEKKSQKSALNNNVR